jgi:hypothetical protein
MIAPQPTLCGGANAIGRRLRNKGRGWKCIRPLRNYFGSFAAIAVALRESSTGWKSFSESGPTHFGDSVNICMMRPMAPN